MQQPEHSCIIEQKRDTDYLAGSIPFEIRVPDGNHETFLPDFDRQKINGLETDACVPFSAVQSIETQINYFIKSSKLPAYHLQRLKDLGFIEANGQFHASERFIAKLDGTNENGTAMVAPWDAIRKYGLIPFSDCPFDETITNWPEFYAPITQNLLDKGQEFLKLFSVQYEWIVNGRAQGTDVQDMKTHLQHAPLCIGVPVCEPWDQEQPPVCAITQPAHSTMVYNVDTLTHFLDHYAPFLKQFDFSYNVPYVMKGVCTITPQAPTPPPVLPANATVPQISTWLDSLKQWLIFILNTLKGRQTLGSTSMNTFWNWLAKSSADPSQVALTVKGIVTTIVPVLLVFVHNPNLSTLPDDVYSLIVAAFGIYSAVATVYGLGRKIILTAFPPTA